MADPTERILIVDDDQGKRYIAARQLRAAGFEVLEAGTGAEGLALVREVPDLAILDIKLPDANGLDLCRHIKADPVTSSVLVLALSARYTSAPDRTRGLEHGADGYLVHPVDGDELIATVRALLRLRRAERDRQRLAGEIEASERRYQTITETTTVGLCLVDAEGHCTFLNRAAEAMLGRDGAGLIGRRLHDLLGPHTPDGLRITPDEWVVSKLLTDGVPVPSTRQLIQGARAIRIHVELSANPIVVAGRRVGAVVEIKDVEPLVRAERQRDLFLATLGHDLRGPLQTITFGASMLQRANLGERETATLARMVNSTMRMERLIEHILSFARTLVEGVPLVPRPVDLVQICAAVVREAGAREPTRALDLAGVAQLEGVWDPDRLTQVVDNLVGNALRHGDGLVTVAVERDGNDAVLTVHNLGRPIPSAAITTLFDPFRRATERSGGVGLGLYIVDQIVRAHGGTIVVTSNIDHGTSFRVRLPIG